MNRMIPTGLLVVLMVSVGCSQGTPQRDHADAPVPPSDTANLSEAVATEEAATAFDQVLPSDPATAPPPVATAAPFATFADWCVNQASLTPDARHTVGVLLTTAAMPDCHQAAAQLTNLRELELSDNQLVDVAPLASLTNLTRLYLDHNQLVDVAPLASLTNLTELSIDNNDIVDVSPLASLTHLTWLSLGTNEIVDISPLASLTNLTWLSLWENYVVDVSPLASLTNLTTLYLGANPLETGTCPVQPETICQF